MWTQTFIPQCNSSPWQPGRQARLIDVKSHGSADSTASHTQVTVHQRLPWCYWRRVSERPRGTPLTGISMGLQLCAPVGDRTMCMCDRKQRGDQITFQSAFEVPEWNKNPNIDIL